MPFYISQYKIVTSALSVYVHGPSRSENTNKGLHVELEKFILILKSGTVIIREDNYQAQDSPADPRRAQAQAQDCPPC